MSELTDVLEAIESLSARGERMSLATIVAVRGSTYRRPGARLLVPEEGAPIGNISGGCLEGDVADVARIVMREGVPRIAAWDLTAEDDDVWGLGLGCNGAIEVFVEPAERAAEVAGALRAAIREERPIAMVTVLEGDAAGARVLVRPDGATEGSLGDPSSDGDARAAALEALAEERSSVREVAGRRSFVEVLDPPLRLVVCGAGHDVVPVVRAGAALGWNVVVADDRPAFLTHERFPDAGGFVALERPDLLAERAPIDERTFVLVMSHAFLRDKEYLRAALGTRARAISLLGPTTRTRRLLDELRDEGVAVRPEDEARIHGPAGLDLGSEGPEEIAAAIVAEIVAVRRGREGGFLRERVGPIHDRALQEGWPGPAGAEHLA